MYPDLHYQKASIHFLEKFHFELSFLKHRTLTAEDRLHFNNFEMAKSKGSETNGFKFMNFHR